MPSKLPHLRPQENPLDGNATAALSRCRDKRPSHLARLAVCVYTYLQRKRIAASAQLFRSPRRKKEMEYRHQGCELETLCCPPLWLLLHKVWRKKSVCTKGSSGGVVVNAEGNLSRAKATAASRVCFPRKASSGGFLGQIFAQCCSPRRFFIHISSCGCCCFFLRPCT